jgi:hypothetical protein
MKSRIEELLHRYWEGETSLEEERELKKALQEADGFDQEKAYFGLWEEFGKQSPIRVQVPTSKIKKIKSLNWLAWAASLALVISSVWVGQDFMEKKEQEQAYYEVMDALALIQANLEKGREQMQPLNDLKYLNTADQLFLQKP